MAAGPSVMKSGMVATAIFIVSFAGTTACLALIALTPHERQPVGLRFEDVARFLPMQASLTIVGALIVWRRSRNPSAHLFAGGYAVQGVCGDTPLPRADIAAWVFSWLGAGYAVCLAFIALTFPDGQLRNLRARVGAALALVGSALLAGLIALRPGPLFNIPFVDNPFAIRALAEWQFPLFPLAVLVLAGAIAFIVSALWERLRHSTGDERQQLKWVLVAVGLLAASLAISLPLAFADWELAKTLLAIGLCLIPASIGIAILRHRLYDIDVLINRTLVYGATTATLLGLYAVIVLVALALLRPVTQGSELAVAVSTLAVASLIQPVRRRIQRGVDRRFYRSRYDAARTVDALAVRLRDEVDLDALRRELVIVVRDTMEPAHASVWLRRQ
ncbi:MAG: hypothetical protein AUH85_16560 [Chloroflexi bacterium 13_1_40CM_4_68_4]|nr:MAG: hypothetical protein AUH85_16560 [Chloroflexi bacterium 13_1_40CM_4_68_4]